MQRYIPFLLALCLVGVTTPLRADAVLWIDDASGNIGQVDIITHSVLAGSVHSTGQILTDIGFNSTGTLYGTTFSGLYSINTSNGNATSLGSYGYDTGMNALVGTGGIDLLADSSTSTNVYTINPSSPSTESVLTTSPVDSAGDLAFSSTTLYESGVGSGGDDELVNLTAGTVVGLFSVSGTNLTDVFGLADNGVTMFAVAGTEVYSVNLSTAALTPLFDYSIAENGQSLGSANGAAFVREGAVPAVPEPSSVILLLTALLAVAFVARKRFARCNA